MDSNGKSGNTASGASSVASNVVPIPTIYANSPDQKKALKEKMAKEAEALPEQPWSDLLNAKFHHLYGSFKENTLKVYESSPSRTMRFVAVFAGLLLLAAVISLLIAQRDQSLHSKFRFPLEEITVTDRAYNQLPSAQAQASVQTVTSKFASNPSTAFETKSTGRVRFSTQPASTDSSLFANNDVSPSASAPASDSDSNDSSAKKSIATTILITAGSPSEDSEDPQPLDEESMDESIDDFGRIQRHFRLVGRFGNTPSTTFTQSQSHPRMMMIERLMGFHFGLPQQSSSSSAQSVSMQRLAPTENSNKIEESNDSDSAPNVRILIHGPASSDQTDEQRTRPISRLQQYEQSVLDQAAVQPPSVRSMEDAPMLLRYAAASMLSRLVAAAAAAAASNQNPMATSRYADMKSDNQENAADDQHEHQLEMAAERIARFRSQEDDSDEETVPVLLATVGQHVHQAPRPSPSSPMMRPYMARSRAPFAPYPPMRPPFVRHAMAEQRDSSSSSSSSQPMVVMLAVPMSGPSDSPNQPMYPPPMAPFHPPQSHFFGPYSPSMYRSVQYMQPRSPFYGPNGAYGVAPPPPPPPATSSAASAPNSNAQSSVPAVHHVRPPMFPANGPSPYHSQPMPPYAPTPYYPPTHAAPPPMYSSQSQGQPGYAYYTPSANNAAGPVAAYPITNKPGPVRPPFSYFGQPVANADEQPDTEQHMIVLYDADSSPKQAQFNSIENGDRDDDSPVPPHARQALHQLISAAASAAAAARQRQQQAVQQNNNGPSAPPQVQWRSPNNVFVRPINSLPSNNLAFNQPATNSPAAPQTISSRPISIQGPSVRGPFGRPVEFPMRPIEARPNDSSFSESPQENSDANTKPEVNLSQSQSASSKQQAELSEAEERLPAQPMIVESSERPSFQGQPLVAPVRIESNDDATTDDQSESEISPFSHFAQIIRSVVEQQHQQEQQEQREQQRQAQSSSAAQAGELNERPAENPRFVSNQSSPSSSSSVSSPSSSSSALSSTPSTLEASGSSNNESNTKSDYSTSDAVEPETASGETSDSDGLERESKQTQPIAQESTRQPAFIMVAEPEDSK